MHPKIFFRKASSDDDEQYDDSEYQEFQDYDYLQYSSSSSYSESLIQQESNSSQMINYKLLRQNLQNFEVQRGIHSYIDISTLTRLGTSSYVQFQDRRHYKINKDLNRHYIGVPKNEQEFNQSSETKTNFHNELFNMEDQRYVIDIQILQLKYLLKKTAKLNFTNYCAFQSLATQEQFNIQQQIEQQIQTLMKEKQLLKENQKQELLIYNLTIDQQYYNALHNELDDYTTNKIIQFYQSKQNKIFNDAAKAFQIQNITNQPNWLKNMENSYIELQQDFSLLQPPLQIFSFQNEISLKYSCFLLNLSIKKLQQTQHVFWMTMLFKDFLKSSFSFTDTQFNLIDQQFQENPKKAIFIQFFKNKINFENISNHIQLQNQQFVNQSDQFQLFFDNEFTQPCLQNKDNLQFFPNFSQFTILYGETLFLELFHLHQELYFRLMKIFNMSIQIEYEGNTFLLSEIIIFLIISLIKEKIQDYEFYAFIKYCFNEESAIQIQNIIGILYKWKKGFFKINENNKELLMIYTQRILGVDACLKIQDAKLNLLSTPENILRRMVFESSQTKLCRFQNINNIIFAHHFILQDLQL